MDSRRPRKAEPLDFAREIAHAEIAQLIRKPVPIRESDRPRVGRPAEDDVDHRHAEFEMRDLARARDLDVGPII